MVLTKEQRDGIINRSVNAEAIEKFVEDPTTINDSTLEAILENTGDLKTSQKQLMDRLPDRKVIPAAYEFAPAAYQTNAKELSGIVSEEGVYEAMAHSLSEKESEKVLLKMPATKSSNEDHIKETKAKAKYDLWNKVEAEGNIEFYFKHAVTNPVFGRVIHLATKDELKAMLTGEKESAKNEYLDQFKNEEKYDSTKVGDYLVATRGHLSENEKPMIDMITGIGYTATQREKASKDESQ